MSHIPLGKYRHYKGHTYEVLAVGKLEATLEDVVIYKSLEGSGEFPSGSVWVRPVTSFTEQVEVNGVTLQRFTKIE